jgi:lactate permease
MLFAWALGALLEGLVGFGYPWAFVAPILITLGIPDLDAVRVAAIANNAPVSYGALGAPIIALAAVTGYPLTALSASVGHIVAILALLPPWVLIYLVSGKEGLKDGWPLAIVGSLGYIAGQFPVCGFPRSVSAGRDWSDCLLWRASPSSESLAPAASDGL